MSTPIPFTPDIPDAFQSVQKTYVLYVDAVTRLHKRMRAEKSVVLVSVKCHELYNNLMGHLKVLTSQCEGSTPAVPTSAEIIEFLDARDKVTLALERPVFDQGIMNKALVELKAKMRQLRSQGLQVEPLPATPTRSQWVEFEYRPVWPTLEECV